MDFITGKLIIVIKIDLQKRRNLLLVFLQKDKVYGKNIRCQKFS